MEPSNIIVTGCCPLPNATPIALGFYPCFFSPTSSLYFSRFSKFQSLVTFCFISLYKALASPSQLLPRFNETNQSKAFEAPSASGDFAHSDHGVLYNQLTIIIHILSIISVYQFTSFLIADTTFRNRGNIIQCSIILMHRSTFALLPIFACNYYYTKR